MPPQDVFDQLPGQDIFDQLPTSPPPAFGGNPARQRRQAAQRQAGVKVTPTATEQARREMPTDDLDPLSGMMLSGGEQLGTGLSEITQPGARAKFKGASDIVRGEMQTTAPFVLAPTLLNAPVATVLGVAEGFISMEAMERGLKAAGVPDEYAEAAATAFGITEPIARNKAFAAVTKKYPGIVPALKAFVFKAKGATGGRFARAGEAWDKATADAAAAQEATAKAKAAEEFRKGKPAATAERQAAGQPYQGQTAAAQAAAPKPAPARVPVWQGPQMPTAPPELPSGKVPGSLAAAEAAEAAEAATPKPPPPARPAVWQGVTDQAAAAAPETPTPAPAPEPRLESGREPGSFEKAQAAPAEEPVPPPPRRAVWEGVTDQPATEEEAEAAAAPEPTPEPKLPSGRAVPTAEERVQRAEQPPEKPVSPPAPKAPAAGPEADQAALHKWATDRARALHAKGINRERWADITEDQFKTDEGKSQFQKEYPGGTWTHRNAVHSAMAKIEKDRNLLDYLSKELGITSRAQIESLPDEDVIDAVHAANYRFRSGDAGRIAKTQREELLDAFDYWKENPDAPRPWGPKTESHAPKKAEAAHARLKQKYKGGGPSTGLFDQPTPRPEPPRPGTPEAEVTTGGKVETDERPAEEVGTAPAGEPGAPGGDRGGAGEPAPPRREAGPGGQAPTAGNATTVLIPGEQNSYQATYQLKELDDLQASHSGLTFQENPEYAHRNDRDYTKAENQGKVINNSGPAFEPRYYITDNPDPSNGPPMVDSNGHAYGGNGRLMTLQRVYGSNRAGADAYRNLLRREASRYGIDPAAVDSMKQPVLVREVASEDAQRAVTDFNKVGTAALRPAEKAIADSRMVKPATLERVGGMLESAGADATLSDVLSSPQGANILQSLIDDGVITPQEQAAYIEGNKLTADGKSRIERLLLGRFFADSQQMDHTLPSIKNRLARLAGPLVRTEADPSWSITGKVRDAMNLIEEAKGFKSIDDFLAHGPGMFREQVYPPDVISIGRGLQASKQGPLVDALRQYSQDASYATGGGGGFLGFGDVPTPAKSLEDALGAMERELAPPKKGAKAEPAAPPKPGEFGKKAEQAAQEPKYRVINRQTGQQVGPDFDSPTEAEKSRPSGAERWQHTVEPVLEGDDARTPEQVEKDLRETGVYTEPEIAKRVEQLKKPENVPEPARRALALATENSWEKYQAGDPRGGKQLLASAQLLDAGEEIRTPEDAYKFLQAYYHPEDYGDLEKGPNLAEEAPGVSKKKLEIKGGSARADAPAVITPKKTGIWTPGMPLDAIPPDVGVPTAGDRLVVEDVGRYLEQQTRLKYGRVPSNATPKTIISRILAQARPEYEDQMKQPYSGVAWYGEDGKAADRDLDRVFPEFKKDPRMRSWNKVLSAALANNATPKDEAFHGARLYEAWKKGGGGKLPFYQPGTKTQWPSQGAGSQIIKLNLMQKELGGPEAVVKWMKELHTGREIKRFRPNADAILMDELYPGSFVLGNKLGPYYLNISGIETRYTTVDKWDMRGWGRRSGRLIDANGDVIEVPTPESYRPYYTEAHHTLADEFGHQPRDAQSVLWHYEQGLWRKMGLKVESFKRSDGTARFLQSKGITRGR